MIAFDGRRTELDRTAWELRDSLYPVVLFSLFINLLQLVPTLYMLQITERVLTSRDGTTLMALSLMTVFLFIVSGVLEWTRSRLLVRLGLRLDESLTPRVMEATLRHAIRQKGGNATQPLQDLSQVRQFSAGTGLVAFFDAPWTVIFSAVIFLLHPLLGAISLAGALILFGLTLLTERTTQGPLSTANQEWQRTSWFASSCLRNAEVIAAMGMAEAVRAKWAERYTAVLGLQALASDRAAGIGASIKFARMGLQALVLGTGAWLAIDGKLSAGAMFAGSILMGRMFAPVELGIANWRSFIGAREAYGRLSRLLEDFPQRAQTMDLPAPRGDLRVENLVVLAPQTETPILRGISFAMHPGEAVAVVGPSASGKSTLARALVGVWPASAGTVRLDGSDIFEWDKLRLGPHIGYLPQDIELFGGTVAENIARFGRVEPEKVIAAAKAAGLHDLFLRLPNGYDTLIGEGGGNLSGGQRQRIGLARALYGNPALVVLDEPDSNLDEAGEAALLRAIGDLKDEGKTVFLVTHRAKVVCAADKILVLREGKLVDFGPRDGVLAAWRGPRKVLTSDAIPATEGRP